MNTTVRDAVVTDAPLVAAINLASWEAAYRGLGADAWLDAQTLDARRSWWSERLLVLDSPVLVAEADGKLIGYCSLSLPARDADCANDVAEIPALYVTPTVFRSGAGSALMSRALAIAADAGYVEMILWVLTANARARAFYTRHGFTPDGTVKWLTDFQAEEIRLRRRL